MLFRLYDHFLLRGWKGRACALVDAKTKEVFFFRPDQFNILLLCDGVNELDLDWLSDDEKETIQMLLEKGFIFQCHETNPLLQEQEYLKYSNRYVKSVLWSITGRCNFRCRHCYMDAPNGVLGEVSHEEAISIIDQMAECGIMTVTLTGGEPFVRADIWELIERISSHGIYIDQIYTNGWLVNEAVLDKLEALGQKPEFSISFDCLEWHDWMRGVVGAQKRVLDVIELCQRRGFAVSIEICTHKGNISKLRDTICFLGDKVARIKVGSVMNTELWKKNCEGYAFNIKDYFEAMLAYIPRFFEDGMPANLTLGSVLRLEKGSTRYKIIEDKHDGSELCLDKHVCGAARMYSYVTPEGRLLPCMPMIAWKEQESFPKIQDIGLKEGLTGGFYMNLVDARFHDLFERNDKCNACEYKLRCGGGCRGSALEANNGLYGADPVKCFYWKNGYLEKIRKTTEDAIKRYCEEDKAIQ